MAVHFDLAPFEDCLLGDGVLMLLRRLRAFEEAAESALERRVIGAVAEAVRIDSFVLERCRDTLFQCLWNRLFWASSATSAAWYVVGDERAPGLLDEPALAEAVQGLLRDWGQAKQARHPGFPWVRSLRPPDTPLGHGLLARSVWPRAYWSHLAFSKDGTRLSGWLREALDFTVKDPRAQPVQVHEVEWSWREGLLEVESRSVESRSENAQAPARFGNRATSPDGSMIIRKYAKNRDPAGDHSDDDLYLADAESDALLAQLPVAGQGEYWMHNMSRGIFSPDGRWVAGEGWEWDGEPLVCLWRLRDEQEADDAPLRPREILHQGYSLSDRVNTLAFSPDSEFLAVGMRSSVEIFATRTQERRYRITGIERPVGALALSPDNRQLAVLEEGGRMSLWDIESAVRAPRLRYLQGRIGWLGFSERGSRLYSQPWLWDGNTGELVARIDDSLGNWLEGGPPQPDHHLSETRLWSLHGLRMLRAWDPQTAADATPAAAAVASRSLSGRTQVAFCQAGRYLAVAGRYRARREAPDDAETVIRVFDLAAAVAPDRQPDPEELGVRCHAPPPGCMVLSHAGARLAVGAGTNRGTLAIFDTTSGTRLWANDAHGAVITHVLISGDDRIVISAGEDRHLRAWEMDTGRLLGTRDLGLDRVTQRSSSYSREGGHTVTERDRWSGTPAAIDALHGWCGFVANRPEGPYRLANRDGLAEILDTTSERSDPVAVFPDDRAMIAHPSGRIWAHTHAHIALEHGFPPRHLPGGE